MSDNLSNSIQSVEPKICYTVYFGKHMYVHTYVCIANFGVRNVKLQDLQLLCTLQLVRLTVVKCLIKTPAVSMQTRKQLLLSLLARPRLCISSANY